MSSQNITTEEYGLEAMDSGIDKDPTTPIGEDSKLVFSQDPPPKVNNSSSFCKKWSTSINSALICIVFCVAMVAFGLSVLNLVQRQNLGMPTAVTTQQTQKDTDFMVRNLTSRTLQLEVLLKEANMKLDEMSARLERSESNDTIIELNLSQKQTDLMVRNLTSRTIQLEMLLKGANMKLDEMSARLERSESNDTIIELKSSQKQTDLMVRNLTLRVMQVEMLLNIKLDEMEIMLEQNNEKIVELNSSRITILEKKIDLLDDKLKAHITTLKNALNKTATNVSSLAASQMRTQIQLAVQDARLDATVNETDSLSYQVSNLQSVQMATQSQLTELDARHNVTATTVSSLSSQVVSLKSTQALAVSDLAALDAQHNTTVAMVDDLISHFSALETSVHIVQDKLAIQDDTLNAAVTALDSFNETILVCCRYYL